jgi:two-component system sensor histidine kinase KdpD
LIHSRPNPDALLSQATRLDDHARHGRLKIFFGAAPGVGKTYAMLESAHARKSAGVDVVVGVLETHGRAETAALLKGLEILPLKAANTGEVAEFDLDGALLRAPSLILVDELAHTNARGSRHRKRWQDVEELLAAGIDVYTTLNVQHVESLNDVVAQITGVVVRETVPDSVLDLASDIELLDLPSEELIERLKAGKVYVPEQATRALAHFFQPGNLNALRELALRRTADRVDSEVNAHRGALPGAKTWPVQERLVLAIGPSPFASNLVRAAKRLASQWDAEWFVLYVQSSQHADLSQEARAHLAAAMKLAESFGAEAVSVASDGTVDAIIEFARSRNATRILAGKAAGSRLVPSLIEASGEITVIALDGGAKQAASPRFQLHLPPSKEYLPALAWILAATLLSFFLRERIALANLVMIHLLAVIAVAMRHSRPTAISASILSVASFDFFCVPPFLTFAVSDTEYLLVFAVMLAVALIISSLTVRLRGQAVEANHREARTQSLLSLAKRLASAQRIFDVGEALTLVVSQVFRTGANVFLPDHDSKIQFRRRVGDVLIPPPQEEGIAQWVLDHGKTAGRGTDTLPGALHQYHPLKSNDASFAVLAIQDPPSDVENQALLDAFCSQASQAIERLIAREDARQSEVAAESERLRNSLLSSVSHDLRTPITSISNAASALLDLPLPEPDRRTMLLSIANESRRMNRLVTNLLEVTRLANGQVQLRKDWTSLEELIASTVDSLQFTITSHNIVIAVAPNTPLIQADAQLLGQALQNLIENAARYAPSGSTIVVEANPTPGHLRLAVNDEGPGFAPADLPLLFDKFFRGATSAAGTGLGLAIVKGVADAHGGQVHAANRIPSGARVEILLPLPDNRP